MSNSLPDKNANKQGKPDIQFTTGDIGRWASQQEDPFAEQNRKRAIKKQERNRKRQKAAPIVVIITSIILVSASIFGLVILIINLTKSTLPEDIATGSEGASIVNDDAQKIYNDFLINFYNHQNSGDNSNSGNNGTDDGDNAGSESQNGSIENPSPEAIQGAMNAVNDYFERHDSSTNNTTQRNDLTIIQMAFYASKGQPQAVIEVAAKADVEAMPDDQKGEYWGLLMNASFGVGDDESAQKYAELLNTLPQDDNIEGADS